MIMDSKEKDTIVLDEYKLASLKRRIYQLEQNNYKSNKKVKDTEMIDRIIRIITQEVDNVN